MHSRDHVTLITRIKLKSPRWKDKSTRKPDPMSRAMYTCRGVVLYYGKKIFAAHEFGSKMNQQTQCYRALGLKHPSCDQLLKMYIFYLK